MVQAKLSKRERDIVIGYLKESKSILEEMGLTDINAQSVTAVASLLYGTKVTREIQQTMAKLAKKTMEIIQEQ